MPSKAAVGRYDVVREKNTFMRRLPKHHAPFIYGIIQSAITTAIAIAITTHQLAGRSMDFLWSWLASWGLSWLSMLPIVILVSPLIQRAVQSVTQPASGIGSGGRETGG